MEQYKPSGKHPHFIIISLFSILSGIIAGLVGFLILYISIGALRSGEFRGFKGIFFLISLLFLWLLILPISMGMICSRGSTFKSQNPKLSGIFSIVSALIALGFFFLFLSNALGLTFWQWVNLNFKKLPQSGINVKFFLHLFLIYVLFFSSYIWSIRITKRPICEKHNKRFKEVEKLKIPGLDENMTIESILERDTFDDYIQGSDYSLDKEKPWGEVSAYYCPKCDKFGYITIIFHRFPENHMKDETTKRQLCSMIKINENQVKSIKRIKEAAEIKRIKNSKQ